MRDLALDLAGSIGWASRRVGEAAVTSGVVDARTGEPNDPHRFLAFTEWLSGVEDDDPIVRMIIERPFARGMAASATGYGLLATAQVFAIHYAIPWRLESPSSIKKHATDNGNASKDMMMRAAVVKFTDAKWVEGKGMQDQADALWLLDYVESLDKLVVAGDEEA